MTFTPNVDPFLEQVWSSFIDSGQSPISGFPSGASLPLGDPGFRFLGHPTGSRRSRQPKRCSSLLKNASVAETAVGTRYGWLTELSTSKLKGLFALRKEAVAR